MPCPTCSARQLVEIDVTVAGRELTLHSCSRCDTRWWDTDGEAVELRDVIDLATVRKDAPAPR